MDKKEAYRIIDKFNYNDNPTSNDEFIFIEACNFIIETENDTNIMCNLGGYYYEKQKYDLAEKYYLMADENGNDWAADGLGFIYYYGRNGARDYKKAFHYFSIAKQKGNKEAAMKIADMYRNGYGVNKDLDKYKELILEIYEEIKDTNKLFEPYPEISHRLADIYISEGKNDECIPLLIRGKSFIAQRIRLNPFWGNYIVCRRIVTLLYKVLDFNPQEFDFYDLFYVLLTPKKVKLIFHGKEYIIESFYDEDALRVKCEDKYYKSIEDFLIKATFNNLRTFVIDYESYYELEVCE